MLDYHQVLLRGHSPLTVAERELIAAYVSGLNACGYCHRIHNAVAEAFGTVARRQPTCVKPCGRRVPSPG